MEIYQLRYFVYAAKYENITMAAQELNVSQPSISKAIQSLERELKTELLRKNGRSCVLTRDGYLLQERVVPLLEEIERLPLEFHNRQKKKLIRLNVPDGLPGREVLRKQISGHVRDGFGTGGHEDRHFRQQKGWKQRRETSVRETCP